MRNFFTNFSVDFEDEFWGITWCTVIFGLFTLMVGSITSGARTVRAFFTVFNAVKGIEIDGAIIGIILAFVLLASIIVAIQELLKRAF